MLPSSLLAGLLALAMAAPQSKPPPKAPEEPAAQFAAALLQVQQTAERGAFQRAWDQLHELLYQHRETDYALRRQIEIVDLARRCAFGIECPPPKLADVVSGELVRWDAKSGDFEIRYAPGTTKDFQRQAVGSGSAQLHPARFVDTFTIEIDFGAGFSGERKAPRVMVGLDTDESFIVNFGDSAPPGGTGSYKPPQLMRIKDGVEGDTVDQQKKPAPSYAAKGTLKVTVGAGGVTAYRDGKRVLQGKRSTRESGHVALLDVSDWNRVTLKGRIQASWPQGVIDAATRVAREAFEARWKPEEHLPAWLFTAAAAAAAAPAGDEASDEAGVPVDPAFAARLVALTKELKGATTARRIELWQKFVAELPDLPFAWTQLAYEQLRSGKPEAAQATCDAALAKGHTAEELDDLPQLLAKTRTGPSFTRAFVQESANYIVKSDIDQATCVAASKVLEESYRSYRQRLAPVSGLEQEKFRVFLFAGEAGYHDYAKQTLGEAPENTAGVYSRLLKQLLIWNLPDREAMFRTVRHEGFHQYLDRLVAQPPTWFNEGMAEYYELADLFGGAWTEGQTNKDHVRLLRDEPGGWLALDKLFALDARHFYGGKVAHHYAQSWLVVHWLRSEPKEARDLFDRFWRALLDGLPPDEAMRSVFGASDRAALERALIDHLAKL